MSKSSRVRSNLIQQNCFVRDVTRCDDLKTCQSSESSYYSLDEVVNDNGFVIVKNLYPYPITPDVVDSYIDSSDYRRDPASAIVNGRSRPNLGDLSNTQKILSMDSNAQRDLYNQLKAKFSPPASAPAAFPDSAPASNTGK